MQLNGVLTICGRCGKMVFRSVKNDYYPTTLPDDDWEAIANLDTLCPECLTIYRETVSAFMTNHGYYVVTEKIKKHESIIIEE